MMFLNILYLTREDLCVLRVKDAYSLHRVVFSLFDDVRNDHQKQEGISSGLLFTDKGFDQEHRKILILSTRPPNLPKYGRIESKALIESFLMQDCYGFEITLNPTKKDSITKKITPLRGEEAIKEWFINKAPLSWGFEVKKESLHIQNMDVKNFNKKGHHVTLSSATLVGQLTVIDQDKFIQSFQKGIGRGKAFGFGLLQITPLLK